MTNAEKKLTSALLRLASESYSNHGCNDFNVCEEAGLTPEEADDLWHQLGAWDDPELGNRSGPIHTDWLLMRYLADSLDMETAP